MARDDARQDAQAIETHRLLLVAKCSLGLHGRPSPAGAPASQRGIELAARAPPLLSGPGQCIPAGGRDRVSQNLRATGTIPIRAGLAAGLLVIPTAAVPWAAPKVSRSTRIHAARHTVSAEMSWPSARRRADHGSSGGTADAGRAFRDTPSSARRVSPPKSPLLVVGAVTGSCQWSATELRDARPPVSELTATHGNLRPILTVRSRSGCYRPRRSFAGESCREYVCSADYGAHGEHARPASSDLGM